MRFAGYSAPPPGVAGFSSAAPPCAGHAPAASTPATAPPELAPLGPCPPRAGGARAGGPLRTLAQLGRLRSLGLVRAEPPRRLRRALRGAATPPSRVSRPWRARM